MFPATAAADATDDYPIPHRMIVTTCTAEQILAAGRDYVPVDYERYIIDKHNKSPEVQQAVIDNAHYFYSLSPADRRAYSEEMVTNFADPMTASWPNWAKIFFNNKGVAAKETDPAPTTHPMTNPCGTGHPPNDEPVPGVATVPPLLRELLRPRRQTLAAILAAMLVQMTMSLTAPWPLKVILDNVAGSHPPPQ